MKRPPGCIFRAFHPISQKGSALLIPLGAPLPDPRKLKLALFTAQDGLAQCPKELRKRRDKIGRTGIFLKYDLFEDESFEKRVKTLMDTNPAIKRNFVQQGKKIKEALTNKCGLNHRDVQHVIATDDLNDEQH